MRTNSVRTEMRCRKATRADRHAGCVNQRRVLRDTSQHATRMTGLLHPVSAVGEADCKPGAGLRRMRNIDVSSFDRDPNPAQYIFCLLCRPVSGRPFLYTDVFMSRLNRLRFWTTPKAWVRRTEDRRSESTAGTRESDVMQGLVRNPSC